MVDYAIAQGIADPDKLGVGGWSYGGISTDFIIGHTNRFKAAISGAGAAEFTSMWGHDQYVRDYVAELGLPWEHREVWDRVAPFWHAKDIHTPTMFVGGSIDWNVPVLGGEQMFESLKALGRDTLLVVYPDEYHEFKTPTTSRTLTSGTWLGMPTTSKPMALRRGRRSRRRSRRSEARQRETSQSLGESSPATVRRQVGSPSMQNLA